MLSKRRRGSSTTGKMFKRISNFQIEFASKNLSGNDIKENFVGVFPTNHLSKFIGYKSLISEKKASIRF